MTIEHVKYTSPEEAAGGVKPREEESREDEEGERDKASLFAFFTSFSSIDIIVTPSLFDLFPVHHRFVTSIPFHCLASSISPILDIDLKVHTCKRAICSHASTNLK